MINNGNSNNYHTLRYKIVCSKCIAFTSFILILFSFQCLSQTGNTETNALNAYGMGLKEFKKNNYFKADSLFTIFKLNFPSSEEGYYWCFRSKFALDNYMNMKSGMAAEDCINFINKTHKLVNRDNAQILLAYFYMAEFSKKIENNLEKTLNYLNAILNFEPNNLEAKRMIANIEKSQLIPSERDTYVHQFGTITDSRDGKRYKTIKIGNQVWMAENLNTDKFRNGDKILEVRDKQKWYNSNVAYFNQNIARDQPAWCYYQNDPANGAKYGRLYNGHAVVDSRNICPVGWHLPSAAEWRELSDYLGGPSNASLALKSTEGWIDHNIGTNSSGFSALESGNRSLEGNFANENYPETNAWWSSTRINGYNFTAYTFYYNDRFDKEINSASPGEGKSVRCIKNSSIVKSNTIDNNNCLENFREISINDISGTAKKYQAKDGHYYYQVKIFVKPNPLTAKCVTKITVNRTQKSENVPFGSIYRGIYINGSSGTFTFDGSFETDFFEIEGTYSCNTGRFGGPSAKIFFRDLKIIQ